MGTGAVTEPVNPEPLEGEETLSEQPVTAAAASRAAAVERTRSIIICFRAPDAPVG
jgi:hypothetical protein